MFTTVINIQVIFERHEDNYVIETHVIFINIALSVLNTLHGTLASICCGLAVGSTTNLRSARVTLS